MLAISHRDELGSVLNKLGLLGEGVEVGALSGGYSRKIIESWRGEKLWLVDTWGDHNPDDFIERTDWTDFAACKRECEALAEEFKPHIALFHMASVQASRSFADDSLSFVYIDASHALHDIAADIHAWWRKVKPGGVFGGHDYRVEIAWPQHCEVKYAVDALAQRIKMEPLVTPCTSWWFRK